MARLQRPKIILLIAGDLILFYLGLFVSLSIRRQGLVPAEIWSIHQIPFLIIHLLWLAVFYIAGMYEIKNFSSIKKTSELVFKTLIAAGVLAVLAFYFIPTTPVTKIEPKTTLLIDALILAVVLVLWRRAFGLISARKEKTRVLFFGEEKQVKNLAETLGKNSYLGYEPVATLSEVGQNLNEIIKKQNIDLIAVSRKILEDNVAAKLLYDALRAGASVIDFETFYESITEKIPVYLINEGWFFENLFEINKKTYEKIKRIFDIIAALILLIPTAAVFPFIWLASKIESSDTIWVRQKRVGKNGEIFTLVKFRSMYRANDGKAKWAKENDERITKIGGNLRKTRLDELPQLINVLKGEMSFIGPRPERPEFVKNLEKEIPHYAMRYLVKPGLSGWAQIKFPYGSSVEDATEKLQYDLYYIKNRSLVLDLAIAAKTIAVMLGSKGR